MKKLFLIVLLTFFTISNALAADYCPGADTGQCVVVESSYTLDLKGSEFVLENWTTRDVSQFSPINCKACEGTVDLISPTNQVFRLDWKSNPDNTLTIAGLICYYNGKTLTVYDVPNGVKTKVGNITYITEGEIPILVFK